MPCPSKDEYFDADFYDGLSDKDKETFYGCIRTGVDNPDSGMGCYAMTPTDYSTFAPFFKQVIGDYHKNDPAYSEKHVNDWDASGVGEGGVLDLQKLGLAEELSMRVRVGRNLSGIPLPGAMTKEDRIAFEIKMGGAFEAVKAKFGGAVYSISPDLGDGVAHPNKIDDAKYEELVKAHSDDKKKIIWFGEEDQLRIMVMKKGFLLNEVFDELKELLDAVESIDGISFAKDDTYGYVTSCPTNLGTGMRASVHVKIPNLTKDGTDTKAKEIAGPLGLSVRGTGGEHTPIGRRHRRHLAARASSSSARSSRPSTTASKPRRREGRGLGAARARRPARRRDPLANFAAPRARRRGRVFLQPRVTVLTTSGRWGGRLAGGEAAGRRRSAGVAS
ncbi:hypothetical protein JL722_9500 [Aureococcus anophagefferens]|nr:hypothetical protein JL722_9500 [Aureococcus anophagefferens]